MAEGRLARAIAAARARGRAAFIPYLTAGDPSLADTARFAASLKAAGADILELGVPFSDPIADGPVNQKAAERALGSGTTLGSILNAIARLRRSGETLPLVLFTYYNPVLSMGLDDFAGRAREAGADGALIVDLPPEEAGPYLKAARAADLETVFLASPTTSAARLALVDAASSGFVYYVSRLGVTGESDRLSDSLDAELARARRALSRPLAVGFGISTPEQAAAAGRLADAVVVGSALVKLAQMHPPEEAARRMDAFARSLVAAMAKQED